MKSAILSFIILLSSCTQSTSNAPPIATPPSAIQVMRTQDAKQCPDGSWVGRSGAKCEFVCK